MSLRVAIVLSVLVLGCTDQPSSGAADSGSANDAAFLPSRREIVRLDSDPNSWIVRRLKHAARSVMPASDAGRRDRIIPVLPIVPDAGVPSIPPDAGRATPPDEEDAGSQDPSPCETPDCLCTRICERGLELDCPEEDPLAVCVEHCGVIIPDCYDELVRVLLCSVALPDAAYSCDPDLEVFVVDGCEAETLALQTCSRF